MIFIWFATFIRFNNNHFTCFFFNISLHSFMTQRITKLHQVIAIFQQTLVRAKQMH